MDRPEPRPRGRELGLQLIFGQRLGSRDSRSGPYVRSHRALKPDESKPNGAEEAIRQCWWRRFHSDRGQATPVPTKGTYIERHLGFSSLLRTDFEKKAGQSIAATRKKAQLDRRLPDQLMEGSRYGGRHYSPERIRAEALQGRQLEATLTD